MNGPQVVIKETDPLRLAEVRGVAAGLGPEHIGPVLLALAPELIDHLQRAGAQPGTLTRDPGRPRGKTAQ